MALQPNLYILSRNSVNNRNINKPNILVIIEVHRLDSLNFTYNENMVVVCPVVVYIWLAGWHNCIKRKTYKTRDTRTYNWVCHIFSLCCKCINVRLSECHNRQKSQMSEMSEMSENSQMTQMSDGVWYVSFWTSLFDCQKCGYY